VFGGSTLRSIFFFTCNFEVNLITHLGVLALFSSNLKDLPMIDAQFRFNQCNSFREENISVFSDVNTMTCGGSHLGFLIGIKN
jgi:hypothetical protein